MIEWIKTERGECKSLSDVPDGATVEYIDDVACVGNCEVCGEPILETSDYVSDIEGVMIHNNCYGEEGDR